MNKKEYSSKQEKMIAEYLDWNVVTGSGSRTTFIGDVVSDEWLGECKTHTTPGHSILFNSNVWDKISKEASSRFKYPVLFCDDGSQKVKNTFCMFPATVYVQDMHSIKLDSTHAKHLTLQLPTLLQHFEHTDGYNVVIETSVNNKQVRITNLETFRNVVVL